MMKPNRTPSLLPPFLIPLATVAFTLFAYLPWTSHLSQPGPTTEQTASGQSVPDLSVDRDSPDPTWRERPELCFSPDAHRGYVASMTGRYAQEGTSLDRIERASRMSSRWSWTASNGGGLESGDPTVLTWSYLPDGTRIGSHAGELETPSNLHTWLDTHHPGGFEAWHSLFAGTFARWSQVTGVAYVYEPNDDGADFPASRGALGLRGDIRIGGHRIDGVSGVLAYNFYPNTGDMVLDTADPFLENPMQSYLRLRNVIAHEHGHGLGIRHVCPINGTKLMEPYASAAFDGPQHDDILGAQTFYGDAWEDDDTIYRAWALQSGSMLEPRSIDSSLDQDWLRIRGQGHQAIDLRIEPLGEVYPEGPPTDDCVESSIVDTTRQRDLGLELIGNDRKTLLARIDDHAIGEAETLSFTTPGTGDYYLRVFGDTNNRPQLYRMSYAFNPEAPIVIETDFERHPEFEWEFDTGRPSAEGGGSAMKGR